MAQVSIRPERSLLIDDGDGRSVSASRFDGVLMILCGSRVVDVALPFCWQEKIAVSPDVTTSKPTTESITPKPFPALGPRNFPPT